jgi:hypothetical protein
VAASSTEIRARIEATRRRLDENLDALLKELAPNEAVARHLRRPVTLALVGAGAVLALALPKTPPERLLKRKRGRHRPEQPKPAASERAWRGASLLENLPPRLLRALADAGVASFVAKRWLERRRSRFGGRSLPHWLEQGLSQIRADGHGLPSWLERVLPAKASLDGHPKRRGVLRFLR